MKRKTPYLILWYVSFLFLAIALLLFGILIALHWSRLMYGYFAIGFLAVFVMLFLICRKPLHCDDGYSLPQAIAYYRACTKAGCDLNTLQQNDDVLLQQAKKENMEDYNLQQLQKCFKTGAKAVREIQNPLLQLFWKQKKSK